MSTCCGRWLGETGEPGAAAQGGLAPARPFPGLGTKGVSDCEAASLRAALLPQPGVGRGAATRAAAAARPAPPALRLPAHARALTPGGLGVQPQAGAAVVARRGLAPASQGSPAQTRSADARSRDRHLPQPGVGARLRHRPDRRRPADQDPHDHRRAHPRSTRHPGSPTDHLRRHRQHARAGRRTAGQLSQPTFAATTGPS